MTTFVEPRDYEEYLAPSERPPLHLLRDSACGEDASAHLIESSPITNAQVGSLRQPVAMSLSNPLQINIIYPGHPTIEEHL